MNPTDQLIADARNHLELLNDAARKREGASLIDRLIVLVRELEAERAGLAWTDAKPTVPGWYWWKRSPDCAAEVIEVDIGVRLFAAISGGCVPVADMFGQFAGPIPPPTEATR